MSRVAILGAGPIGAATAHRLSARSAFNEVLLIDPKVDVARGKALDILQSGPVDRSDTRLSADRDPVAAVGATVIVVADAVEGGEWQDDAEGKNMVRQLMASGSQSPLVFAGARQFGLMEAAARELKVPASRIVGSAPAGLVSALKSLVGIELNTTGVDLTVVGRPPHFVVVWSSATADGSAIETRLPAHRTLAISQSIGRIWPLNAVTLGTAAATATEAIAFGCRSLIAAATLTDELPGLRGSAVALPVELGQGRVLRHVMPALSPQERSKLGT
jgi:malate/lactate dehydrogenase